jgi:hypothetical protein
MSITKTIKVRDDDKFVAQRLGALEPHQLDSKSYPFTNFEWVWQHFTNKLVSCRGK